MRGWWGNPCGFKSRLRHHELLWELGENRCSLFHFMALNGDLNARPPLTNRRKSATYGSASGGRAGRMGVGVAAGPTSGRNTLPGVPRGIKPWASLIGQIPPSAPWQFKKGFRPDAEVRFFVKNANVAHLWIVGLFRLPQSLETQQVGCPARGI